MKKYHPIIALGLIAAGGILAGSNLFVDPIFDLIGLGLVIWGFSKLGVKLK